MASVGVKTDDEDKTLLLLTSLPQSYKNLVIALIVEKDIEGGRDYNNNYKLSKVQENKW